MGYQKKIIKVCKKHGPLTRKEIRKEGKSGLKRQLVCKACGREKSKRYYEKGKQKPLSEQRKKKERTDLKDSYVRELLYHYTNLSAKDIPDWMVTLKRTSLEVKRLQKKAKEAG
jgi:hypothetical protein